MQKEKNISTQEVISMEEYLNKRQKIRDEMLIFTVKVVIIPVDQTINQDVGVTHNRHKNRAGNRCFQKS